MSWAIHAANILILTYFLVSDILVLRLLSIGGGVLFALYFLSQQTPMYEPVIWNILFILVNFGQIGWLWFLRRKIPLGKAESRFQQLAPALPSSAIRQLFSVAEERTLESTSIPHTIQGIGWVKSGTLSTTNGHVIPPNGLLGGKSIVQNTAASSTVIVEETAVIYCWSRENIEQWMSTDNQHRLALMKAVSVGWVERSRAAH